MFALDQVTQAHPAIVSRKPTFPDARERYLVVNADGATDWIDDPERATAFASMREAARMAMRLPASLRAFGLPRSARRLDA